MALMMESTEKVVAGTAAKSVSIDRRDFLLVNASATATVYFKEKSEDGKAATAENGFALLPGETTPMPLSAKELSVIASAAETDVRVLYVREAF